VPQAPPAGPATLTERLRAVRPNQVWAIDFQFDGTADQRRLKLLNVVDEFTKEALAMRVGRSCNADQLLDVIEALMRERGAPEYLRMDNGPEIMAWALRDWCRLSGTTTTYIEPGAPWENPFVESFNGRVRDELLNIEEFGDLAEAQVVVEAWRVEYKHLPSTLGSRRAHPDRVRQALGRPTASWTPEVAGPTIGAPSQVQHLEARARSEPSGRGPDDCP
jgi:putative transposase